MSTSPSSHIDERLAGYQLEPLNFESQHLIDDDSDAATTQTGKTSVPPHGVEHEANHWQTTSDVSSTTGWDHNDDPRLKTLPPGLLGCQAPVIAVAQMLVFFFIGLILSLVHHFYYRHLHHKPANGSSIIAGHIVSDQKKVLFMTTTIVFLVKLAVGLSISKAYDQHLWFSVRRAALKLNGLDALFSILGDPLAFLNLDMVRRAKVAAFLAFLAWTASITLLPVPGSLTVHLLQTRSIQNILVPTINLRETPSSGLIFLRSPILSYNGPAPVVQTVANKALIEGSIATIQSPCGQNCSYNITFFAPSFKCTPPTGSRVEARIPSWEAGPTVKGDDIDTLNIKWISDFQTNFQSVTNCTSYNSTYTLNVAFEDNKQQIDLRDVSLGLPFGTNHTLLADDATFRPALAAIKDAVSNGLIGSVFQDMQTGLTIDGTLVLYSLLANNTYPTNPTFSTDTPRLVEEMLRNASVSVMTQKLWSTPVMTEVQTQTNVFVYNPRVLWAGYGSCIGVALPAIVIGMYALWCNGGGGTRVFSLIMSTTRNAALDDVAMKAQDVSGGYIEQSRFKYGRLTDRGGRVRLAFRQENVEYCQSLSE